MRAIKYLKNTETGSTAKVFRRLLSASILLTLLFFNTLLINAFSISAPYMENNQLMLQPGEVRELQFTLQNGGGATESIAVKVSIREGSEIAQIIDEKDIYIVNPGEKVKVNIRVSMPQDAKKYTVRLGFNTATASEKGNFNFGSEIEKSFEVVPAPLQESITEKEKPGKTAGISGYEALVGITLAIILLIIILIILIKRRKK